MTEDCPEPPISPPPAPDEEGGHWSYGVWIPDGPEDDPLEDR